MTDASNALAIINDMAATKSRSDKERLLRLLADDEIGLWAIKWTYNPFVTFGITPGRTQSDPTGVWMKLVPGRLDKLLEDLATRRLTGNAAAREVAEVLMALEPDSSELLWRILSKDLKCGIAETTINKIVPGLLPVFAVMRANVYETKKVKSWPAMVEPKLDGIRITFLCKDDMGGFFSRSGNRLPAYDHLVEPLIEIARGVLASSEASNELRAVLSADGARLNFMLDCEGIAGNRYETIGTSKRGEQGDGLVLHAFDMMSYADFDAMGSVGDPWVKRRKNLQQFVGAAGEHKEVLKLNPAYIVNGEDDIQTYYGKFLARGLEGAMIKDPNGLYDKGKTNGWLKLKPSDTEDLPIVDAFPGEPHTKYEHCLGGVIVERMHEGKPVQVRVGGGFSDAQREELWDLYQQDLAARAKAEASADRETYETKLLGRLLEVKFQQVSVYGSLEHPRAVRFRDDKAGEKEKLAS